MGEVYGDSDYIEGCDARMGQVGGSDVGELRKDPFEEIEATMIHSIP